MAVIKVKSENFEAEVLKSDKKVLVDFSATWCGPCKMMAPVVSEISDEHDDVKVCNVDIDESPEVAAKYGVMAVPTFIVFENGAEGNKDIGAIGKEKLEALTN